MLSKKNLNYFLFSQRRAYIKDNKLNLVTMPPATNRQIIPQKCCGLELRFGLIILGWSTLIIRTIMLFGFTSALANMFVLESLTKKADDTSQTSLINYPVKIVFGLIILTAAAAILSWFFIVGIKKRRLDILFIYIALDTILCTLYTVFWIYTIIAVFDEKNPFHNNASGMCIFMTFFCSKYFNWLILYWIF